MISLFMILFCRESLADNYWWPTIGPYGSNISKILVVQNGDIYISTKTDGVYKSDSNGDYWQSANSGDMPQHASVNDIAVNNAGTLFAATNSLSILRKTSTGNWSKKTVSGIPQLLTVYVLPNQDLLAGSIGNKIYRSTDDGNTWGQLTNNLSTVNSVYCIITSQSGKILIGTDKGIYKSTNNGTGWGVVDNAIGKVNCFAISDDKLVIMAGTDKGVYASNNNDGENWSAQNTGMGNDKKVISLTYHQDDYFIAGTAQNGLYVSSESVYVWSEFNTGLESPRIQSVATNSSGELLAGSNYAFYFNESKNSDWELRNNLLGVRTINGFATLASRGEVLAATDLGVYRTTDNGSSWIQLNQGLGNNLNINALVISRAGDIFAGTNGEGLFFSTDYGSNWNQLINEDFPANVVTTLDTNSAGILYAGTENMGVYRSNDSTGMKWSKMWGDDIDMQSIISFVVAKNNFLYAGTSENGLFRKDNIDDWKQEPVGTGIFNISALAYLENKNLTEGVIYAATNDGIKRSNDNGGYWNTTLGTLNGQAISIATGENEHVFVGLKTVRGVYIDSTSKNGDEWRKIEDVSGINNLFVKSLAISGRGFVFAGTTDGGCYRSVESTSGRILQLTIEDTTKTISKQQSDPLQFVITARDLGTNPVEGVEIIINNNMGLDIPNAFTDIDGMATVNTAIPPDQTDSLYTFQFLASRLNFLDSDLNERFVDVQRQKVFLEITPQDTTWLDSGQTITYNITATNKIDDPLEDITIHIDDNLTPFTGPGIPTTNADGKFDYTAEVPDPYVEAVFEVIFSAEDKSGYYFPSDTLIRIIKVEHNTMILNGPRNVCEFGTYTYSTVADPNMKFDWTNPINCTFVGDTTDVEQVDVTFIDSAAGPAGFTLKQTPTVGQESKRPFPVTVFTLPVVTLADFSITVCPNEPYTLEGGTPDGGVYSGPGVTDGIFYGDVAGGEGTYTITYTYANDTDPFCENSATKDIQVYPLPNVTLNLDSAEICVSYLPYPLTGGLPLGGDYSGPGVANNIFDPRMAGVDTHPIVYTYTDPVTGCTHTAEQNIVVNDAPTTSFIIVNTEICESDTAFNLSDKTFTDTGTFSGPGVIGDKFNARIAGVGGPHRIIFTTDDSKMIGSCPAKAYVDVTVVGVPLPPTIDFGPKPDTTWLESSSPDNNTWFRKGNGDGDTIDIEEGRHDQRIYPEIGGSYTVTVGDPTPPNCASFHSLPFLFGITAASGSITTIPSVAQPIEPGTIFDVNIRVGAVNDIKNKAIDLITTKLVFNGSLLYPTNGDGEVFETEGLRKIDLSININPNTIQYGDDIETLHFKATVGDEESTELIFENVEAWRAGQPVQSEIHINSLNITIKVNEEGGKRLYNSWPDKDYGLLFTLIPNPAGESFKLNYYFPEETWSKIYISDLNGQVVKTIFDGFSGADWHTKDIDVTDLPIGIYYMILQTPMHKKAKNLRVIR
ncbi:hypothetical protein ACFLSQ_09955 [Bacteroidota bacterium]